MLTRLEVDGFKNLLDFACDFGPYTCIAGPNAVGKSNVFDAIQFLALLADNPFLEAAQQLRVKGGQAFDLRSLFWNGVDAGAPMITFAAEMIVPQEVEDDFGRSAKPTSTFLRYELRLRYVAPTGDSPYVGGIRLENERLSHITKGGAPARLPWPHSPGDFREHLVRNRRRARTDFIVTTDGKDGEPVVEIHQDGGTGGKPQASNPARAPRTVVSTITSSDTPTILAARREMSGWRQLALEPSAMRSPDSIHDTAHVTANGAHLGAALYRMANQTGGRAYAEVSADAAALTDIGTVAVEFDERRDSLTLQAKIGSGPLLPARSLSDGTLRFLALCILKADEDDSAGRLYCMEEPENGIHPARIEAMVDLTKKLVVNPQEPPGPGNPLRQLIVNTHSPRFVKTVAAGDPGDILAAQSATIRRGGTISTTLRLIPIVGTWRAKDPTARPIPLEYLIDYGLDDRDSLIPGGDD